MKYLQLDLKNEQLVNYVFCLKTPFRARKFQNPMSQIFGTGISFTGPPFQQCSDKCTNTAGIWLRCILVSNTPLSTVYCIIRHLDI